jgi:hypothetical protein
MVVPWDGIHCRGAWGIACTDSPFLWGLLCGGTVYVGTDFDAEDIAYAKIGLELHEKTALCELVSHEILDESTRRRRTTYSDGTTVYADFDTGEFCITYPDGREVKGRD